MNFIINRWIVLGDFNLDASSTIRSEAWTDFTDTLSYIDYEESPSTATCIDHVYFKLFMNTKSGVLSVNKSEQKAKFSYMVEQRPVNNFGLLNRGITKKFVKNI